jgi:hypothetical protein
VAENIIKLLRQIHCRFEGGNHRSRALLPIPLPNGIDMRIANQMNLSFQSFTASFSSIIQ